MKLSYSPLTKIAFTRPSLKRSHGSPGQITSGSFHRRNEVEQLSHQLRSELKSGVANSLLISNLLGKGARVDEPSARKQNNALHVMMRQSPLDTEKTKCILDLLIKFGERAILKPNAQGDTPLHVALENVNSLAGYLLNSGGGSNLRNLAGESALDIAHRKYQEVTSKTASSYDANQCYWAKRNLNILTAWDAEHGPGAIAERQKQELLMVEAAERENQEYYQTENIHQLRSILSGSSVNFIKLTEVLMGPTKPEDVDKGGNNAFHLLAANKSLDHQQSAELAKFLISRIDKELEAPRNHATYISEVLSAQNAEGKMALHLALENTNYPLAEQLLEHDAIFDVTTLQENNIFHILASHPAKEPATASQFLSLLFEEEDSASLIKQVNIQGDTPLHLALRMQNSIAKQIIEFGGCTALQNHQGETVYDIILAQKKNIDDVVVPSRYSAKSRENEWQKQTVQKLLAKTRSAFELVDKAPLNNAESLRKALERAQPDLSEIDRLLWMNTSPAGKNREGLNAAHILAGNDKIQERTARLCLNKLLSQCSYEMLLMGDSQGNTPLHIALETQSPLAKILMQMPELFVVTDKHESLLTMENHASETIFDIAARKYQAASLDLMAFRDMPVLDKDSHKGINKEEQYTLAEDMVNELKRICADMGMVPGGNDLNKMLHAVLQKPASYQTPYLSRLLICGANPAAAIDGSENNAVHVLASNTTLEKHQYSELIDTLVAFSGRGVLIQPNKENNTPFHLAFEYQNKLAEVFIESKVITETRNNQNESVADVAKRKNFMAESHLRALGEHMPDEESALKRQYSHELLNNVEKLYADREPFISNDTQVADTLRNLLAKDAPNKSEVLNMIVNQGADPSIVLPGTGQNVFHVLASNQKMKNAKQLEPLFNILMANVSIDSLNLADHQGNTPLHLATENASLMTGYLINSGGYNRKVNKDGETAIQIAERQMQDGYYELTGEILEIVKRGGDSDTSDVTLSDKSAQFAHIFSLLQRADDEYITGEEGNSGNLWSSVEDR